MRRVGFWLRWSWRDLQRRWLLVVAIALVLAIGTGIYSGLGSLENWRKASNDASFTELHAHDLKISLPEGGRHPLESSERLVESLPDSSQVSAVSERLIVPTQIEVSRPGQEPIVTGGQLVGSELGPPARRSTGSRPRVAGVCAPPTRPSGRRARGELRRFHELRSTGTVQVAGGRQLRYVGFGRSPEYFLVTRPAGGDFGGAEPASPSSSPRSVPRNGSPGGHAP